MYRCSCVWQVGPTRTESEKKNSAPTVEKYSRFVRKTSQHERPQIFTKQFDWLDNDHSKGTNPRDGCTHPRCSPPSSAIIWPVMERAARIYRMPAKCPAWVITGCRRPVEMQSTMVPQADSPLTSTRPTLTDSRFPPDRSRRPARSRRPCRRNTARPRGRA